MRRIRITNGNLVCYLTVEEIDSRRSDRQAYAVTLSIPSRGFRKTDPSPLYGPGGSEHRALESALAFASACAEGGEQVDIFTPAIAEVLAEIGADAIWMARCHRFGFD